MYIFIKQNNNKKINMLHNTIFKSPFLAKPSEQLQKSVVQITFNSHSPLQMRSDNTVLPIS